MARNAKNWIHAAGLIWEPLVRAARERRVLNYNDLSPLIPTNNLNVGRALGPIQDYCLDTLRPPLTAIVVNRQTKLPGEGFIAGNITQLPRLHSEVFDYNWGQLDNPFGLFGPNEDMESAANRLIANPDQAIDVYHLVRDRGVAQRLFRLALLQAYDKRCAMCGFSFHEALEASHIVPWNVATPAQRLDVRNGLLLCSIHHRMFDRGLVWADPFYRIHYVDHLAEHGPYEGHDRSMSLDIHGTLLQLPADETLHPRIPERPRRQR